MVSLADYQVGQGFNNQVLFGSQASVAELDDLNKALSAGEITGRDTTNLTTASGAPLKVESLEKTLKVLTFQKANIVFWKNIPKAPAFNTVEEYNQLQDYGTDTGGFNDEGELPQEEDSIYVRRAQYVKFLGITRSVTHPMSLVNTMVGDVIKRETENGTMWILRKLDRALFTGNSQIIPQEFDGIFTQHANNPGYTTLDQYFQSGLVIDMRGAYLTEAAIENAAEGIVENYGLGNELYAPPRVLSDFVKNFYGNKFIQPNTPALTDGVMGQRVKSFESQYGNVGLNWDIFLNPPPPKTTTTAATSQLSPAAPIADLSTPANVVTSQPDSQFGSGDAGNYLYGVTAVNKYGESQMTLLGSTLVAIVANCAVDLKFTDGNGANASSGYTIYRSPKGVTTATNTTFYPLFSVSLTNLANGYDGGTAGLIRDNNRFIGMGTYQALLVQNDNQVIEFKQLAPLMKMDLAITSPAYRFMILMYGTPFLYAPAKAIRFINIGKAA